MSAYGDQEIKSNGKFVKIENDKPHHLHILSEAPYEKVIHGFGKDQISCVGEGCFKCAEGSEVKQRFAVNVFDFTIGKVMIWEYGASIAKQLREIDKTLQTEGTDITKMDIKVSVSGTGMQKKYAVMPWTAKALPSGLVLHKLDQGSGVPF